MRLVLVLHHHQPCGQLPWTVTDAVTDCYAPLLKVLLKHPYIKVALHYSGPLLEMLGEAHSSVLDDIKILLERRQIELLGGAWWEAILPIWPQCDQKSQLQLTRERLKTLFQSDPQGAWLPERVWEPELARTLLESDYRWTLLDDNGLKNAGVPPQNLHQVNRTVEGLNILSIDARLRQLIPWHSVDEVIGYLSALHQESSEAICVYADDAEKFGSWPGTHQLIYEENYLEDLLIALENNAGWLQTALPSACVEGNQSNAALQIPPTSYPEMLEWSRGHWRHFLMRYSESRDMYEAVLRAPRNVVALPHVLKAQCNDVYWHGVFGGLYLPHLRQAVYGAVAQAELTVPEPAMETTDSDDIFLKNSRQMLGLRAQGGQLFLWLDFATRHNWTATLRHYRETDAPETAPADWYARGVGIDHFLGDAATPESVACGQFPEQGDFAGERWQLQAHQNEGSLQAVLARRGGVWQEDAFLPLEIKKTIVMPLHDNGYQIQYEITNPGDRMLRLWWACEWNLTASGSGLPERSLTANDAEWDFEQTHHWDAISSWGLNDRWLNRQIRWSADQQFGMWAIPFQTVSRHESGDMETIFQQSTLVLHQRLSLAPGEKYFCRMNVEMQSIKKA